MAGRDGEEGVGGGQHVEGSVEMGDVHLSSGFIV